MKRNIVVCNLFLFIVMLLCNCTTRTASDIEEVETIKVPFKDAREHLLNMSEFVDSIQYVRLETKTDNMIGDISKLIPLKDRMMIVDKVFSSSIYFFDMQGKYLSKISHRGAGPEEYVKIESVAVDEKGKRVFVLSGHSNKVLVYSMEGEYQYSFEQDFFCREIEYIDDDILACYCDYYSGADELVKEGRTPLLIIHNLKTHHTEPFFYEDISIKGNETIMIHMLSNYVGDIASLTYPLNNFIHTIERQGAKERYYINFGKSNESLQEAYINRLKDENISVEQVALKDAQPDFYQLTGSMLGSEFLCFGYRNFKTQVNGMFFYDLKSKKCIGGQSANRWPIQNDIDHGFPLIPYAIKDNRIYTVIDAGYLEEIDTTNSVLKHFQQTMTSDDNPIIMISTVKVD